jgi:dTDP-4-dehydrorhamnose reductase
MHVLIIGEKGQLGSDCLKILSPNHRISGCDFPEIDLGNPESVDSFLEKRRPEVIINCAAYTAVDNCETDREMCWSVDARGPLYLARAAQRLGSRLIHISTDYVFDGKKTVPTPYIETDRPNPLSEYGKSKLAGEENVTKNCENYLILRTAWLYSAQGRNFLKTMLRLATQAPGRTLKVVDDQYGSLTWSYTLAKQIDSLLQTDATGIVHTTSEGYSSWYGAARYFLDRMGVEYRMEPCTTPEYPTPAHRPANSILENSVLKKMGISVFPSWQEDIDLFVAEHGNRLLKEAEG